VTPDPARLGRDGERLAARRLRAEGYRILGRNLRRPAGVLQKGGRDAGEIDILAQAPDGRTVVVVEVKAGRAPAAGRRDAFPPELHVTAAKRRKLAELAVWAARRHKLTRRPIRFDVITVTFAADGAGEPVLRWRRGAFQSRW